MATVLARTLARRQVEALRRHPNDPRQHIDWLLFAAVVGLAVLGLIAIYSARYQAQTINGLDPYFYVKRQGVALAAGLAGMVIVLLVDYRRWRDLAPWLFGATTVTLVALLLVGQSRKGAVAWFEVAGFQVQPSEFAKVTLILVLAAYLGSGEREGPLPFHRFVVALILAAVPMALTLAQPDLGTASVMAAILMGVLLVAGAQARHILVISAMALLTIGVLIGTGQLDKYQQDRLLNFIRSNSSISVANQDSELERRLRESARQVENSETAISRGGLTGAGFLEGKMTNGGYVPEQHTDFVFAAVGEQFGLVGTMTVLLLFGLLGFRIFRAAQLAGDLTGTLIASGVLVLLSWHVFQNVGMTMGIMPVTGIPAPLLSYGGSSTLAFLLAIGLVQNVHMRRFL
jgi:rod shape determining protein RodA